MSITPRFNYTQICGYEHSLQDSHHRRGWDSRVFSYFPGPLYGHQSDKSDVGKVHNAYIEVVNKVKQVLKERAEKSLREEATKEAFEGFSKVVEITAELFGEVQVRRVFDPEFPEEKYVVFSVETPDIETGLQLEDAWVSRVQSVSTVWDAFRLSLHIAE